MSADRRVVASISGGKDSAAMSLRLTEQGIDHVRVFIDTGWEHPATYEYLRGELARVIGPIVEIRADGPLMEERIRQHGMFPSRGRKWCTRELKVEPMKQLLAWLLAGGVDPINAVGIRAEESSKRAQLKEREWSEDYDCEVWRPIISWTLEQVIAIHSRHGLRPNPLYLQGATRVGCWPCINAVKADVRLLAGDAQRVQLLRALEAEISTAADAPRAWFQARKGWNPESGKRDGRPWPIDKTIEWASSYGQEDLFSDPSPGCGMWGLCEPSRPSPAPNRGGDAASRREGPATSPWKPDASFDSVSGTKGEP